MSHYTPPQSTSHSKSNLRGKLARRILILAHGCINHIANGGWFQDVGEFLDALFFQSLVPLELTSSTTNDRHSWQSLTHSLQGLYDVKGIPLAGGSPLHLTGHSIKVNDANRTWTWSTMCLQKYIWPVKHFENKYAVCKPGLLNETRFPKPWISDYQHYLRHNEGN